MSMPTGPSGPPQGNQPPHGNQPSYGNQPVYSNQPPPGWVPPPPQQGGHYGSPGQQYGAPAQFVPSGPSSRVTSGVWVLALVSILATVLGLTLKEDGNSAWHSVHAWGALAIAGAVATLVPALGQATGLSERRAWQVAACGAGALVLFWILLVLPDVGSNTSLLTTVGAASGVVATWLASEDRSTPSTDRRPPGQAW